MPPSKNALSPRAHRVLCCLMTDDFDNDLIGSSSSDVFDELRDRFPATGTCVSEVAVVVRDAHRREAEQLAEEWLESLGSVARVILVEAVGGGFTGVPVRALVSFESAPEQTEFRAEYGAGQILL